MVSWREFIEGLFFPHLVSGCVNSHCPVFHFELGVHGSSAFRVKSGLSSAWSGVKLSETAEAGPSCWAPSKALARASSSGSKASQPTASSGPEHSQFTLFQVSSHLLSSFTLEWFTQNLSSFSLCELVLAVKCRLRSQLS